MELAVLSGEYAIARIAEDAPVPNEVFAARGVVSVTRAPGEVSIVCPVAQAPAHARTQPGWRVLAVRGPLDFALTGILAELSGVLAAARISVFAVSTFETDYLLVGADALPDAVAVLREAGHDVGDIGAIPGS